MNLTIKNLLGLGWQSFRRNWIVWVVISLIYFVAYLPDYIYNHQSGEIVKQIVPLTKGIGYALIGLVVPLLMWPGLTQLELQAARQKPLQLATLLKHWPLIGKFVIFFTLYIVMVGLGLVLLIIPGIYLALRYALTPYVLVENRKLSVLAAMARASLMTKGKIIWLLGLLFPVMLISVAIIIAPELILNMFFSGSLIAELVTKLFVAALPGAIATALFGVATARVYLELSRPTKATSTTKAV